MKSAVYFEVEEELKRKFNIALAEKGEKKIDVLTAFVREYIKKKKLGG